jgi:aspartyl-tRNA(Asn)/glutamyl-tRNA(Gln) amidotransferase subunit A
MRACAASLSYLHGGQAVTPFQNLSAADLGREIAAGRAHPVEVVESFLESIARSPDSDTVYARLTPDRARAEAAAAAGRAKAGLRRGPLDGVPISWKDLFDSAGTATEAGSALLRGRVPARDADVLAEATRAGLVCLGKTHMSELAFSGLGLNPVTATPSCINDPRAVAGGSSSGAAASVALGLAPVAVGSDTGGSVRIPAAWNDLVGLKTTHGRLSLTGVVPLCEKFDTVGPLARTVEDCALMLAAMENRRPPDLAGSSLSGARLAVLESVALEDLREAPARGFEDALTRLARAGARIETISRPEVAQAMALAGHLFTAEAWGIWGETIEQAPERMFPRIYERFRSGADVSAAAYVDGWRRLAVLRNLWHAATAGYDAVLVPTSPILPPDRARLMIDTDYYVRENLLALRNTRIGNMFGLCALTLPTSAPSCGISLMAAPMTEDRLLRLGVAAELALR